MYLFYLVTRLCCVVHSSCVSSNFPLENWDPHSPHQFFPGTSLTVDSTKSPSLSSVVRRKPPPSHLPPLRCSERTFVSFVVHVFSVLYHRTGYLNVSHNDCSTYPFVVVRRFSTDPITLIHVDLPILDRSRGTQCG